MEKVELFHVFSTQHATYQFKLGKKHILCKIYIYIYILYIYKKTILNGRNLEHSQPKCQAHPTIRSTLQRSDLNSHDFFALNFIQCV